MPDANTLEDRLNSLLGRLGFTTPPSAPAVDPAQQDAIATQAQSQLPPWKQTAIKAENTGVDFIRGMFGLGDQGPAGPTATNAGQLVTAALPMGMSKAEFASYLKSNPELLERLSKLATDEVGQLVLPVKGRLGDLIKKSKSGYDFKAPSLKMMEQAIKAGEGLDKLWEPLQNHLSAFQDDPQAAEMFSRVWGATSPNTPVARNNYESLQAWKKVLTGDIPFTPATARSADITMADSKVPNLNRAIQGQPVQGGRGEIGKTENMAQLILGDPSAIPIDVHALSGVGASEDSISKTYSGIREMLGAKRGQYSATDIYNVAKEAYQRGLDKFGANFPTMWEGIKLLKGQGQSAGLSSWLKKWGLLEPNAMVNEAALNHVIENIDRAEFYGRELKNTSVREARPYVQMLEKHPELGTQPQQVERIADIVRQLTLQDPQNPGTTYNILNGDLSHSKDPLYAVASFPERSKNFKREPTPKQLQAFITKNIDLLKDSSNSIGTWWDKGAKQFTLDITKTIPDRDMALELGRTFKQKAIFDLHKMEEIPVTHLSLEDVASSYAAKKGFAPPAPHEPVKVNKEFGKNVAQAYEEMKHDPTNPDVKRAYEALASEVEEQFNHITEAGGLQVEPWKKKGQPYANSREMMADIKSNNHLYYFPTEKGFGSEASEDHPLLEVGKNGMLHNDMLRIVHDYLAHALGGYGFGPSGEENAFLEHAKLLTAEARKALATETRGQNSWVNFGPHAHLPVTDRPYAPQKAGLLPEALQALLPGKARTPLPSKAPLPDDARIEELLKKFGGRSKEE